MSADLGTAVPEAVPAKIEAPRTLRPISWKAPIALGVLGLVSLVAFGLLAPGGRSPPPTGSPRPATCSRSPS